MSEKVQAKRGRKPVGLVAKGAPVSIRFEDVERDIIKKAAEQDSRSFAGYVRHVVVNHARKCLGLDNQAEMVRAAGQPENQSSGA